MVEAGATPSLSSSTCCPNLHKTRLLAAVERHLAACAAQIAEKEAQIQSVFARVLEAERAGDDPAALRLMKTYLWLMESIEQLKRLAAKEEAVKALALHRLRSLEN